MKDDEIDWEIPAAEVHRLWQSLIPEERQARFSYAPNAPITRKDWPALSEKEKGWVRRALAVTNAKKKKAVQE